MRRVLVPPAVLTVLSVLAAVSPSIAASPLARKKLSAHDPQVNRILAGMTLEEKVGQMTQPEQDALKDDADVENYFVGSVFSGGNSDPKTNSFADWRALYDRLQARTARTRLKIPLLYGVDAVRGHNNVVGAVLFPHNIGLGATRNPALVEEVARVTAKEVRATGINWTFAPCVAVARDERWGRTYEAYSEDPKLVAELGGAATRGLQGDGLRDPLRVLACAKHYVGDGATTFGTGIKPEGGRSILDQGDVRLSEAELRALHMQGYLTALAAGVGTIMPSYNSWNGQKASGSHRLLTEILKDELGFEGFLISDYNAIDQLPGDLRSDIKDSINAGMDMVMVPHKHREFFTTLKDLVQAGEVEVDRIDDAVRRILRVKAAMGLLDPRYARKADPALAASFGSEEHRQVARRAVRESVVLLKHEGRVLPLSRKAKRIHVAGKSADDLGNQCGGWTITWQGKSGSPTQGTTILAALQQGARDANVTYSRDGSGAAGADVAVVVVGEAPYAEFFGDLEDLTLAKEDVEAVAAVKKSGVPTIVVLLSGRPMILGDALAKADAFLAAWLPGTEGAGVADVLFGDYKPTGKLPFTWPRTNAQLPINVGDASYDPLFPYGFGLTY